MKLNIDDFTWFNPSIFRGQYCFVWVKIGSWLGTSKKIPRQQWFMVPQRATIQEQTYGVSAELKFHGRLTFQEKKISKKSPLAGDKEKQVEKHRLNIIQFYLFFELYVNELYKNPVHASGMWTFSFEVRARGCSLFASFLAVNQSTVGTCKLARPLPFQ